MLNYGLKPALQELADNLMELSKDTIRVTVNLGSSGERYAPDIEQHLFRIAQEACENAYRHSKARVIQISGELTPDNIRLEFADDGIGLETTGVLDLDDLLSNKHFGLAGMIERAALINAQINVQSTRETGTMIQVIWKSNSQ